MASKTVTTTDGKVYAITGKGQLASVPSAIVPIAPAAKTAVAVVARPRATVKFDKGVWQITLAPLPNPKPSSTGITTVIAFDGGLVDGLETPDGKPIRYNIQFTVDNGLSKEEKTARRATAALNG